MRLSFLSAYQENVLGLFAVNGVYIATCFVVQQLVSDGVWPWYLGLIYLGLLSFPLAKLIGIYKMGMNLAMESTRIPHAKSDSVGFERARALEIRELATR